MSELSETVVRLDPMAGGDREELATEVLVWLVRSDFLVLNARRDDLWSPSEWVAGSAWPTVTEWQDDSWLEVANNGVDVSASVDVHHPIENLEPPTCARCGVSLDPVVYDGSEAFLERLRVKLGGRTFVVRSHW